MPLTKLEIQIIHTEDKFNVLFNPEEYTINKDNNFAVQGIPGLSAPLIQFVNGNLRTLEMELFFDTWDTPKLPKTDVRDETNKIIHLMEIDSELHAPPLLLLSWASLQFRCVLARVSQKFIMFSDEGKPVRARLSCTFNEVADLQLESEAEKQQTADFTKAHVVLQGETLSSIASKFYDNPQQWRPIAIENEIANPRELTPGQVLRIPSLPYMDPESWEVII